AAASKAAAAAAAAASAATPAAKSSRKANPLKLAEAEKRMAELESKLHTLDMDLADPTKYAGGGDNAAELAKQREKIAAELAKAEAEWMALYDAA
ncbi:hypothetical protein ACLMLE_26855, partial [Lysobacter capsici]